jgi:hypothetical protein
MASQSLETKVVLQYQDPTQDAAHFEKQLLSQMASNGVKFTNFANAQKLLAGLIPATATPQELANDQCLLWTQLEKAFSPALQLLLRNDLEFAKFNWGEDVAKMWIYVKGVAAPSKTTKENHWRRSETELTSLKQGENQPIKAHWQEFLACEQRYARLAAVCTQPAMPEAALVPVFIRSLNAKYQAQLDQVAPDKLDAMLQKYAAVYEQLELLDAQAERLCSIRGIEAAQPPQHAAMSSQVGRKPRTGPANYSSAGSNATRPTCGYCGFQGHEEVACRKKKRAQEADESKKQSAQLAKLTEQLAFLTQQLQRQPSREESPWARADSLDAEAACTPRAPGGGKAGRGKHLEFYPPRAPPRVAHHLGEAGSCLLKQPSREHMALSTQAPSWTLMDTACSASVFSDPSLVTNVSPAQPTVFKGIKGQVVVKLKASHPFLGEVYFNPEGTGNLVSPGEARQRGIEVTYDGGTDVYTLRRGSATMRFAGQSGGALNRLYPWKPDAHGHAAISIDDQHVSSKARLRADQAGALHDALDHPSDAALAQMLKAGNLLGTDVNERDLALHRRLAGRCPACLQGKMHHAPAPTSYSDPVARAPGQIMHVDLITVVGGKGVRALYLLTLDAHTSYLRAIRLPSKHLKSLTDAFADAHNHAALHGHTINVVSADHEPAFESCRSPLEGLRIKLQMMPPGRHERRLERTWQTLLGRLRSVLYSLPYRLPNMLVPALVEHVVDMHNQLPCEGTGPDKTPAMLFTGRRADLKAIQRPFGQLVLTKAPETPTALSPRAEYGLVLARDQSHAGSYAVFKLSSQAIVIRGQIEAAAVSPEILGVINDLANKDVPISVDAMLRLGGTAAVPPASMLPPDLADPTTLSLETTSLPLQPPHVTNAGQPLLPPQAPPSPGDAPLVEQTSPMPSSEVSAPAVLASASPSVPPPLSPAEGPGKSVRRSARAQSRAPVDYKQLHIAGAEFESAFISLNEAFQDFPDQSEKALKTELRQLFETGAIVPIAKEDLTPEQRNNVLPSKAIFSIKRDADTNAITEVKGRVVAGGHMQDASKLGVISSTTAQTPSVHLTLALGAHNRWHLATLDVKGAYLNAVLEDSKTCIALPKRATAAFIELYPGYANLVAFDGKLLLELHRALYGLRQSGFEWYKLLAKELHALGFKTSTLDRSMFYKEGWLIAVHVDDLLVMCEDPKGPRDLANALGRAFPAGVKLHEGLVHHYLGLVLTQSALRDSTLITQPAYTNSILLACGATKTATTPAGADLFTPAEAPPTDAEAYVSRAASLLYLSLHARPDIRLAVTALMQRASCPNTVDMTRLERVEQYIAGTKGYGLLIKPKSARLETWIDASHATHPSMKSHTGCLVALGGALIHAGSNKQAIVSLSSTQSELHALSNNVDLVVWARSWLEEKGYPQPPAIIYQDNQSCIRLGEQGYGASPSTKHWLVKEFYVKQAIDARLVTLQFTRSEDMLADALTKSIPRDEFLQWRTTIGVVPTA